MIFAADGRIVRVNEKFCELTGFAEDELVGAEPPLPYWPPESHAASSRAASADVVREGRGEFDVVLCRKDGERFPAIVTAGVIREDGSRVVTVKDVAERAKLVAENLEAREAFARSAEVVGEYLYSGERMPDESFVMHARGLGLGGAARGRRGDPGAGGRLRRLHPSGRSPRVRRRVALRRSDPAQRRDRAAGVPPRRGRRDRALGARSRRHHGARRQPRAAHRAGPGHLGPAQGGGRARRGGAPAGVALERRRAHRAVQPQALLGGPARPPRRLRRGRRHRARRRRPLQAHQRHLRAPDRRRRAARDRAPPQGRDPSLRRDVALGRRGVLRPARRDRGRGRAPGARRAPAHGGLGHAHRRSTTRRRWS